MTGSVVVAGAGLAGLTAAVTLHQAGLATTVVERRAQVGGASRESAGWIWRYTDLDGYRSGAPLGDRALQHTVLDGFDPAVAWLEEQGVRVIERGTGRTFTEGVRVDTDQMIEALVAHLPTDRLHVGTSLERVEPDRSTWRATTSCDHDGAVTSTELHPSVIVLAGGGYAADVERIARESKAPTSVAACWSVRARNGGDGSTLAAIAGLGVPRSVPVDGECFTRLVPDAAGAALERLLIPFGELGSLEDHRLLDAHGAGIERASHDWSGALQAWELARTTGRGWIELGAGALASTVHAGPVADIVTLARTLGLHVQEASAADGSPVVRMPVVAGLTHSRCGIVVDADAAVVGVPGLYAVGADAADVGRGGTAGGLAQALVLGRAAAHGVIRQLAATTSG
ncbi:MAG: fumarate reductase/succinate dehydrogenase flavoprotein-like protein [Thermoleophilia bacterium]|nr:fumarate reductase/succinate dehydrogenase flavoprotein-like protein [Thermoleophilia bacterium]